MKKISICIPNYNSEKYLKKCIESALKLDYQNKEIILIDDCSTDNSQEIIIQYKNKIKFYKNKKNLGQTKNTNLLFKKAKGDYIILLHSDDYLLPNFARELVPKMNQHNNLSIAVGERFITNHKNEILKEAAFYNKNCIIPGNSQAKVFMFTSFLPCQVLIRKSVLEEIGGVNEKCEVNLDGLLFFSCSLKGDVYYTKKPVAVYRKHEQSTTSRYNRTYDHIIQYYNTLKEMHKLGKNNEYLVNYFTSSKERIGEIALKYASEPLKEKLFDVVDQYLHLALVFKPDLSNTFTYKLLKFCSKNSNDLNDDMFSLILKNFDELRKISYDPPEGSKDI